MPTRVSCPPAQAAPDCAQNPYNNVTVVKSGAIRANTMMLFLDLLHTIASRRSDLSGITTIRFAHWAPLDSGRRLLFCSVYDGSWEAYMSDFVHLAGWGLTGVWTNTQSFPPTTWLLLGGARHEQAFRTFVRTMEVETQFWYRGYPALSRDQIVDADLVRRGLASGSDHAGGNAWLSLF